MEIIKNTAVNQQFQEDRKNEGFQEERSGYDWFQLTMSTCSTYALIWGHQKLAHNYLKQNFKCFIFD